MTSATPTAQLPRTRRTHELRDALAQHLLLAPAYAFWAWIGLGSKFTWAAYLIMATMWVIAGGLLLHWGREGRTGLIPRVLAWALVSSINAAAIVFFPWAKTRRLLVPPPAR